MMLGGGVLGLENNIYVDVREIYGRCNCLLDRETL